MFVYRNFFHIFWHWKCHFYFFFFKFSFLHSFYIHQKVYIYATNLLDNIFVRIIIVISMKKNEKIWLWWWGCKCWCVCVCVSSTFHSFIAWQIFKHTHTHTKSSTYGSNEGCQETKTNEKKKSKFAFTYTSYIRILFTMAKKKLWNDVEKKTFKIKFTYITPA